MADYFFVLDAADFENRTRLALASAWQLRSFDDIRPFCAGLLPAARAYAERYHTGDIDPLLARVAAGNVPFDRALWRSLVAEVLLFSAVEIPEFQVNAATLTYLLTPNSAQLDIHDRTRFSPIRQALEGSRDLTFGSAVYRPEHAGYNTAADVIRLADYLANIHPETWVISDLAGLRDVPAEEHGDELAFAQEWFPALAEMYDHAANRGHVIVHENIY